MKMICLAFDSRCISTHKLFFCLAYVYLVTIVKWNHSTFRKLRCITPQDGHRSSQKGHGQLPEDVGFGGNDRTTPVGRVIESGVN